MKFEGKSFYLLSLTFLYPVQVTNFLRNSNEILFWDTEHFEQDTWDDEAHRLYQEILWDAFQEFWYVPDIYDASDSYNVTLNNIWNKNSPSGITGGGKILLIYEVWYEVIDWKYNIV